jgi:hypothetical protein
MRLHMARPALFNIFYGIGKKLQFVDPMPLPAARRCSIYANRDGS